MCDIRKAGPLALATLLLACTGSPRRRPGRRQYHQPHRRRRLQPRPGGQPGGIPDRPHRRPHDQFAGHARSGKMDAADVPVVGPENVHAEAFEFGRGWWIESARVPHGRAAPAGAALRSRSPGRRPTNGAGQRADRRRADPQRARPGAVEGQAARQDRAGQLPGRRRRTTPRAAFQRFDDAELGKLYDLSTSRTTIPSSRRHASSTTSSWRKTIDRFMAAEGALALVQACRARGNGLVHGEGYFHQVGETAAAARSRDGGRRLPPPGAPGQGRRGASSRSNSNVHFDDRDINAYNVLAEIPGSDPQGRLRDGRRPPRQLGGRRRRRRQRRRLGGGDGSGAHPGGSWA